MAAPHLQTGPATQSATRASWREILSRIPQRSASRSTQVYLVCSARARVGKTLTARLIVEYCRRDARPLNAFMISPIEVTLNDFLPRTAAHIALSETRGQMALFDRLVVDDATTKIVDIGHQALDQFFTLAYDIQFATEANRHGIDVLVVYVADPSEQSQRTYAALRERFPEFSFVPAFNEAIGRGLDFRNLFPSGPSGVQPLMIPKMSASMHAIVDNHPFSFIDFLRNPPANLPRQLLNEIDGFLKRAHRQLREIELSLLLNRLRLSLNESAD